MNTCDAKSGICETSSVVHSDSKCCGCSGNCGGDPMVCKMNGWHSVFHEAKKSVQMDIIKDKIQKLWGSKLEKEATAVMEAMEAKWSSLHSFEHAKDQLIGKFEQIDKEKQVSRPHQSKKVFLELVLSGKS